jgi:apolipoprotein N-acyltransferase
MATLAVNTEEARVAMAEAAWPPWPMRLLFAVVSGILLAAAFPKLDWEPLAWVGLVPLLVAVRGVRPGRAFLIGWLSGTTFYVLTCYWIVHTIDHYTALPTVVAAGILLLMAAVLGAYTGAFTAGLRWLEQRGVPAVWIAPPLWVTLEWLRGWFFIGFPWAALGYSQYRFHDLVQMAEVTGVYGLSAVVVLFNVVAAEVLRSRRVPRRAVVPSLMLLTVLVIGLPAAGRWRAGMLAARPAVGHLRVGIAQGNIQQDHKWDPAFQGETLSRYRDLTRATAEAQPALVVWPETATPFYFQEPTALREEILDVAQANGVHLLFGSPAFAQEGDGTIEEMNRAYLVSPAGREVATYDKMQLVPFGEYVPYHRILFFVDKIVHGFGGIVPGLTPTVFHVGAARFGTLICYEGVFPALTRQFVLHGADFLVNITNDAWYGPTSAPYQSLAQVTLRAVENRVPLVRSANTGLSAIIDPDGRIRWQGPLEEIVWHVDEIAWPGVRTFYTAYGDVFAYLAALATLVAFGYGLSQWRRTGWPTI